MSFFWINLVIVLLLADLGKSDGEFLLLLLCFSLNNTQLIGTYYLLTHNRINKHQNGSPCTNFIF